MKRVLQRPAQPEHRKGVDACRPPRHEPWGLPRDGAKQYADLLDLGQFSHPCHKA